MQATLCKGSISSDLTSQKFQIAPGPTILLSLTLGGSTSISQISKQVEQKIASAVASSLALSNKLVQVESTQNARRRALAVSMALRIYAVDFADATKIQQKVKISDIQVRDRIHMH
jgi:hypothetical protein